MHRNMKYKRKAHIIQSSIVECKFVKQFQFRIFMALAFRGADFRKVLCTCIIKELARERLLGPPACPSRVSARACNSTLMTIHLGARGQKPPCLPRC